MCRLIWLQAGEGDAVCDQGFMVLRNDVEAMPVSGFFICAALIASSELSGSLLKLSYKYFWLFHYA